MMTEKTIEKRKARAKLRRDRRKQRHAEIEEYLHAIDLQVAIAGAENIPKIMRRKLNQVLNGDLAGCLETITAPFAETLIERFTGVAD